MTATSRSGRFQPTGRPDSLARGPLTKSVQSDPLSSRHTPSSPCLTISATAGGGGLRGLRGGLKPSDEFGGGFTPPYGPSGFPTTFFLVPRSEPGPLRTVEALPDSKIAT